MKKIPWLLGGIAILVLGVAVVELWPQDAQMTGTSNAYVITPYPAGQVISSPVEVEGAIRATLVGTEVMHATGESPYELLVSFK